jgi:RNA polymerase subunit RPABC4/transcription elongation factor Spt4
MRLFEKVQEEKRKRQEQEQQFMTQQMNIQTGSIERITSQGIDKGVVDGATIQEIARQMTNQRALDRTDAKVDSMSKAEAAKNDVNTFKDAENRERKHQVDMTGQSAQMMDAAKQNVPHTLVQGSGITPSVHVSVPGDQTVQPGASITRCRKCNQPVQPGWKICPACGEPLSKVETKCSCGALIEKDWKFCPVCGKPAA